MLMTTIIRWKRAKVMMHNIKIKNMSKNIKKKKEKIIIKIMQDNALKSKD